MPRLCTPPDRSIVLEHAPTGTNNRWASAFLYRSFAWVLSHSPLPCTSTSLLPEREEKQAWMILLRLALTTLTLLILLKGDDSCAELMQAAFLKLGAFFLDFPLSFLGELTSSTIAVRHNVWEATKSGMLLESALTV